jgi:hypothetical protein
MNNAKHAVALQLIESYRLADAAAAEAFRKIAKLGKSRLTQCEIKHGLHNAFFTPRFKKVLTTNDV